MNHPIFILGTHRSGTTLLTRMLSAHPDIFIQNEISVENIFTGVNSPHDILINIDSELVKRHGIDITTLLKIQGKNIWGIKDPQFTEHLDSLYKYFHDSKYILIIRDPRAVVNSYIENKWGLGTNVYSGAQRWKKEVNQQMDFLRLLPNQGITIKFENFITDTEVVLKDICTHINTGFNPAMISHYKTQAMYRENLSNINTGKPLNPEASYKWRHKLNNRQISIIESVCAVEMIKYGYEPVTSTCDIPWLEKFYYRMHQMFIGELQIQFQLKRILVKKWLGHINKNA